MTVRRFVALVSLVFSTFSLPALAQSGAAAEALFREGADAADAGNYPLACEKFEASQALDPAAGTLLNIADCKEHLGLLASAWQLYLEAAAKFPEGDQRVAYARKRAQTLEPRLPRVVLEFENPPTGAQVYRKDELIPTAALGTALPVDPGTQTYRVEASGHEPASFEVVAVEAETQKLVLSVGPATVATEPALTEATPAPAAATAPTEAAPPSARKTWGWVSLGVGAVGLAVGTATGIMVIDKKNLVDQDCADDFCRTDAGTQAAQDGATLSVVSTVSFIVGALGTGTGLYLLLAGPKEQPTALLRTAPTWGGGLLSLEGTL